MDEQLSDLRARIARGEYQIEPTAVAEAILRRLLQLKECSYPDS
jgi:anti-sigma28 factor (negative regulator of flagellin synthesis)